MINPKYVGIAAGVGFLFTFLIGLFSGVGFAVVLLRSIIGALVFGVLGAGVPFLFQRFLSDADGSEIDSSAVSVSATNRQPTGGLVDITIDDDTVRDDAGGPRFTVADTRAVVSDTKPAPRPVVVAQESPAGAVSDTAEPRVDAPVATASSAKAQDFTPVSLTQATQQKPTMEITETASQAVPSTAAESSSESGGENVHSPAAPQEAASRAAKSAAVSVLDELPDLSDMAFAGKKEEVVDDEVLDNNESASEEAASAFPMRRSHVSVPDPSAQNAAVMAQAIQTILAREN